MAEGKGHQPEAFADVDLETEYDEFFSAIYGVGYPDFETAG